MWLVTKESTLITVYTKGDKTENMSVCKRELKVG